jgi:DNA relaxase NicK
LDTYLAEIREIEGYKTRGYRIDKDVQNFGKTLYVGSRASDQFGRVYDKAAEQRDPVNIHRRWRYEVEYKNDYAREGLDNLLSLDEPTDLPPLIQNTVWFWFDHRGIPPLFERTSGKTEFEVAAKVTDTSRKLSWLSTQVRPTIQELMRAGLEDEVFRALGISRGES